MSDGNGQERIAVIGLAGRFPRAENPGQLWSNFEKGIEGITRFEPEMLEYRNATEEARASGLKFAAARGVLENAELFDAAFFGIPRFEAEVMDPQHRVFLECAWEVLEDAGYDPARVPGLVGVFAGSSMNTYLLHHLCSREAYASRLAGLLQAGEYAAYVGSDKDFLPTRVSYKLDLRGPSLSVQTACSSSLVAVSQACESLLSYQCDMALAGGVSITFPQKRDYPCLPGGMMSEDGTCRAFDAEARGTVFGHGAGIVLLKRLSEALADGDAIRAVILGSAVNNDGSRKVGYAAPSVAGQAEVIALAQAAADVEPDSIGYIEAHGTGTPLGDPVEIAGLVKAFRDRGSTARGTCWIGSAKPWIGHMDAAAGVTGLIKTILQLEHERIAPLLHFHAPNPHIDFASSPFAPAGTWVDWRRGERVRRAGVTSLGVGGTNVHLVVEEAPRLAERSTDGRRAHLLPVSARSDLAARRMCENLARHLEDAPSLHAADVALTLQEGRRRFSHRAFAVTGSDESLQESAALEALRKARIRTAREPAPEVVFLFPGQGSQVPGMGSGLEKDERVYCEALGECEAILERLGRAGVSSLLSGDSSGAAKDLSQTSLAQPAIFSVSYALARLWMSWGVRPAALIGHSVGEYVAAVLAGYWTLDEALEVLIARSELQSALPEGGMLAVRMAEELLRKVLVEGVCLAAINSPRLCVVSGRNDALDRMAAELKDRGIVCQRLSTSHAFHSDLMDPMLDAFRARAERFAGRSPGVPWVSTLTGDWIDPSRAPDAEYWARQVREPVLFERAVGRMAGTGGRVFLEVGPGRALTGFALQHPDWGSENLAIASLPDPGSQTSGREMMLTALGALWSAGVEPDWEHVRGEQGLRRVPLPTYPFERERYWVDALHSEVAGPSFADEPQPGPEVRLDAESAEIDRPEADNHRGLEADVASLLQRLSGMDITDLDKPFMEYGLDSLFLTQASLALQASFGVSVSFRQLLGEFQTVRSLAQHLETVMPDVPLKSRVRKGQVALSQQAGARFPVTRWPGSSAPSDPAGKRFGPFKPIQPGHGEALSPERQTALDTWIPRYVAKTRLSKKFAQEHRVYFADPRAVAGFDPRWKEMVYPLVAEFSKGSHIRDLDGNDYVDLTMGFGAYFFGHSPDFLMDALREQLEHGIEIGPQNAQAGVVARELCALSGLDRVTFCNTGSEAVMAAIRLTRTVTGRNRIVFFNRDYHGMFDEVLVRGAWPGGVYQPVAAAPGIPPGLVENALVLEYGDRTSLEVLRAHAEEVAAVIVEPVQGRNPGLQPAAFLKELRQVCDRLDVPLVFDEVVTGFRCHPGGAQAYFGVQADLAAYGKVVGGGIPVGLLAGRAKYMDALDGGAWNYGDATAPETGMTFFAGTFVRHPLALAAMRAVLATLKREGPRLQIRMCERTARLVRTLNADFAQAAVPMHFSHFSSWAWLEHGADPEFLGLWWYLLREQGIHWWEGRPLHLTLAHSDEDLDRVVHAFRNATAQMCEAGFLEVAGTRSGGHPLPSTAASASQEESQYPREDQAPTTEAVREILLASRMGDDPNCGYNEAVVLEFWAEDARDCAIAPGRRDPPYEQPSGPDQGLASNSSDGLDLQIMRRALGHLVERHAALRSHFCAEDDTQIFEDIPPDGVNREFPLHDLSDLTPEEAERSWLRLKGQETSVPFDLSCGPLFRAALVRHSQEHHSLLVTAHHAVCDGWSFGMLIEELARIYSALRANTIPLLPPPFSFADYARHLASKQVAVATTPDEDYWVARFSQLPPALELPTDRIRPAVRDYAGAMATRRISGADFQKLKSAAAHDGGTLFSFALAGFAALLRRLTDQNDFVVGVPAAGQLAVGQERLIGHCLNFLPLRLHVSGAEMLSELRDRVAQAVLEAYDHQSMTLGSLLKRLKILRDPSRSPLVSVMFNVDRSGLDRLSFPGLKFEAQTNPKQFVNFELFFNLVQTDTHLEVECEYLTGLWDEETIAAWLDGYVRLLVAQADRPELTVDAVPVCDRGEAVQTEWPHEWPVSRWFCEQASLSPDQTAVRCGKRRLSYRQLREEVLSLAADLIDLGVKPGQFVGLSVERTEVLPIGILGILCAGAAYVPLDPALPEERLRKMVVTAGVDVILVDQIGQSSVASLGRICVPLGRTREPSGSSLDQATPIDPGQAAYALFTSGSTGEPKGVVVPHGALTNFLHAMWEEPGMAATDVLLAVTTFSFDISLLEMLLPLVSGACVVIADENEARDAFWIGDTLGREGVTVLQATPTTWQMLLESGWRGSTSLKALIGGEAVPRELVNRLVPLCGELWNLYGPTEATIWCASKRLMSGDGPVRIGHPITHLTLDVVNSQGQIQPVGVPGHLLIGGRGLAIGYLARPDLTTSEFLANPFEPGQRWYRSGDLAKRFADGGFECLGRLDHQIKFRGFRIEPGEIETLLAKEPGISQAVVVSMESGDASCLAAFLRVAEGQKVESISIPALKQRLKSSLPDYMVPSRIELLQEFPLTSNGKVNRKQLALRRDGDWAEQRTHPRSEAREPEECEVPLLGMIRECLKAPDFGVTDDVFEWGGDSMVSLQISLRAKAMGLSLAPLDVFRFRTVRAMVEALAESEARPPGEVEADFVSEHGHFQCVNLRAAGRGPALMWMHGDWLGGGGYFATLLESLPRGFPAFLFSPYQYRADRPPDLRIAAREYASAVRKLAPGRPVVMGGFCVGAWLALETGAILKQEGVEVSKVLMLDPPEPPREWMLKLWKTLTSQKTWDAVRQGQAMRQVLSLESWLRRPARQKVKKVLTKAGLRFREFDSEIPDPDSMHHEDVPFLQYLLAFQAYRWQPTELPVVVYQPVLQPGDRYVHPVPTYFANLLAMRNLCGDHLGCLRAQLPQTAEALSEDLVDLVDRDSP